jgi:hypothetical protein
LGVSLPKAKHQVHDRAWESVRKNEMARELARAKESVTSPKCAKERLGDEDRSTVVGLLRPAMVVRGL